MPKIEDKLVEAYPCPTCRNDERHVLRGIVFSGVAKDDKPLVVVRCARCNYEEDVFYYTQHEDARSRYDEIEKVALEKCIHCHGHGSRKHLDAVSLAPTEYQCLMCQGKGQLVRYSEFFVRPHTPPPEAKQDSLTFTRPDAPWSF